MYCNNCQGTLRVLDGLCVHCRLLGVDRVPAAQQRSNRKWLSTYSFLANILFLACIVFLVLFIGSKYDFIDVVWSKRSKPGVLAPDEPQQLLGKYKSWNYNGYLFEPLAKYRIEARVLLKSNYWFSPGADLSPIDLTFGWGPMSDQSIIDQISLSSGYRYYFWSASTLPIPADEINRHAANHHLVPKDDSVKRILKKVSVGDVVTLSGYLVQISRADGWNWKSSLTREDSGGGACELMWVESAYIQN